MEDRRLKTEIMIACFFLSQTKQSREAYLKYP